MDWIENGVPEEIAEKLEKFGVGDVPTLAKMMVETRTYVDSTARVPREGASSEEWQRFYRSLGVPESPDSYTLPEGAADFREQAHEANLTDDQFRTVATALAEQQRQAEEERQRKAQRLREEWAEKARKEIGDDWEETVAAAQRQFLDQHTEEEQQALKETGLAENPALLKALALAYKKTGDGRVIEGDGASPNKQNRAQDLANEWRDLRLSEDMKKPGSAEYMRAVGRLQSLNMELRKMGYSGAMDPKLGLDTFQHYQ